MNDYFSLCHNLYVDNLKKEVEKKAGFTPAVLPDFQRLRDAIEVEMRDTLSLSTLKRFWGYIEGWQTPRLSSLDILARYVGHNDYRSFVAYCNENNPVQSKFLLEDVIAVSSLTPDTEVELTWLPDRRVKLRYEGDCRFIVIENQCSKLKEGYKIRCAILGKRHPLYADVLIPGMSESRPYLAGKDSGINFRVL